MPHHDFDSVGRLLEIIHEEVMDLHRKVNKMSLDISKLTASEQALIGVVEKVLVVVGNQQTALKTLSDQLAAAIAANDPVNNLALQTSIDTMAATLDTETQKVGAALLNTALSIPVPGSPGIPVPGPAPTPQPAPAQVPTDSAVSPVATPPSPTPTTGSSGSSGPQETGSSASVGAPTPDAPPATPPTA